jgi:ubiquinol-cytochrome c reductase cytochrome c subunit
MKAALVTAIMAALAVTGAAAPATGPPAVGVVSAKTGSALYAANCSSCHGPDGRGIAPAARRRGVGDLTGAGPSLAGAGALAADFYLRTGYMPLAHADEQPSRSHVLFTDAQLEALVGYVASLGNGPAIPTPRPFRGNLSSGQQLFADNCAGCHQIAGEGGYVTGARVPPLSQASNREIAEAVRIGPYLMPKFGTATISNTQLDSIVRYVDYAKHPDDPGGWSIGRIGPVPEGMVAWLIAGAALVAVCVAVSRKARFDER